ncbi:MAG: hypothetical protein CMP05_09525 [Xanthomarina sp.]|uniref:DUF2809 domain-containing protein n=1 Tax=Xanthomarina gelatinilytica TaxID=1137281 RepID=A0A3D6BMZ0_9FLAO|nr:DUF2809 domain-containing protein [Xanthomarina sp.]HAB26428.1 DUF2809 domain-containing protein [Xanthomarina gelatinilytica]MAL23771.1 hypothetical protein [Xanthomarina sp.]MBF62223.1 hypothetical protein [Xanthomarina sp.]HAI19915.1 DUF2809 domain-containing protein [Xanthomarina gelatinilytica]HCY80348.1 DUF2809 domain-containing protein [Xanthomarina gelatinilytica]|tara:strand:+ start:527 stop:901 length:375 start_codon:yes stop_codon:yes gene_type:complete
MKLNFNKTYFVLFSILFIAEILIAKYVVSGFIRHTFGDFLVVILIYGFLKSFLPIKPLKASILVLIIAFCIEFLQLCNLLEWLNLQNNTLAKLVLGSTFQVTDLLAYTLGILLVLIVEYKQNNW